MSLGLRSLIAFRNFPRWKLAAFLLLCLAFPESAEAETKGRLHLRLRTGYTYDIYTSSQARVSDFTQSSIYATADVALLLGSTNYFEISNTTSFTLLPLGNTASSDARAFDTLLQLGPRALLFRNALRITPLLGFSYQSLGVPSRPSAGYSNVTGPCATLRVAKFVRKTDRLEFTGTLAILLSGLKILDLGTNHLIQGGLAYHLTTKNGNEWIANLQTDLRSLSLTSVTTTFTSIKFALGFGF